MKTNSEERLLKISFCPKCKSKSIRYIFTLPNLFGLIPKQKCLDCGFQTPIFPIMVIDRARLKEKSVIKSNKRRK